MSEQEYDEIQPDPAHPAETVETVNTVERDPAWRRWVFGLGVIVFTLGLGLALVPKEPSTGVRVQGAVMAAVGLAAVWVGRMSLAARRKSSAWDRGWR